MGQVSEAENMVVRNAVQQPFFRKYHALQAGCIQGAGFVSGIPQKPIDRSPISDLLSQATLCMFSHESKDNFQRFDPQN